MVERPLLLFPGKAEASRTKKPPFISSKLKNRKWIRK